MDKQSHIVPRASLQLYETESVLYRQLVLAYITPGPSVKGRRGYCQSFPQSHPADADQLMEGFGTQQNDKKSNLSEEEGDNNNKNLYIYTHTHFVWVCSGIVLRYIYCYLFLSI